MMFSLAEEEKILALQEQNHKTRNQIIEILIKFGLLCVEQECGQIITARLRANEVLQYLEQIEN